MERVVVYELSDGSKQCFSGFNAPEDEAAERQAAEREMASRDTDVVNFISSGARAFPPLTRGKSSS